jgi:hypothetical protein
MTDFSIQVQTPPQIVKPENGSPITKDSKLSWSSIRNGMYLLDLSPDFETPTAPHIQAYVSGTQLGWPDLKSIGVEFPSGITYTCQVSGLIPYASIDDLASSEGPYKTGLDRQQLDSDTIDLVLVQ